MNKVERIKKTRVPAVDPKLAKRLPPGQALTERFPILHEGDVPVYDLGKWNLKVFGEVDNEVVLTYDQIKKCLRRPSTWISTVSRAGLVLIIALSVSNSAIS